MCFFYSVYSIPYYPSPTSNLYSFNSLTASVFPQGLKKKKKKIPFSHPENNFPGYEGLTTLDKGGKPEVNVFLFVLNLCREKSCRKLEYHGSSLSKEPDFIKKFRSFAKSKKEWAGKKEETNKIKKK